MRPRSFLTSIAALLALVACRGGAVVDTTGAPTPAAQEAPTLTLPTSSSNDVESHASCATLRDEELGDVIHASSTGRVLYAQADVGLVMVDASIPDEPRVRGLSAFTGTPYGVFERADIGLVAFSSWSGAATTTVRAVDLRGTGKLPLLGEVVLAGEARDVRRTGDVIAIVRDSTTDDDLTTVTTVGYASDGLRVRDEIVIRGRGGVTGGSPWGLAIARPAEPSAGPERTSVTFVSVGREGFGSLQPRGTSIVEGVVPRWRRAADGVVELSEDNRVRLIGCATSACSPGTAATFAAIDFTNVDAPRIVGWSMIGDAGADGVFRFDGERLVAARRVPKRADVTELAFFDATTSLRPLGAVVVRGTIATLSAHDDTLTAVGWTGSASAGKRGIVHRVDAKRLRLLGSASFGRDWTWSPAWDDDRALSFDPASALAALPVTTIAASGAPVSAVQVFSLGSGRTSTFDLIEVEAAPQRLVFVGGRLLAFGNDGVTLVEPRSSSEPAPPFLRGWKELEPLVR